eukprot:gene32936-40655_t
MDTLSTDALPTELIRTSIHLPENFLCDSGFIYETVFKRPPTSVIREALQMLSSKAFEKNALTLNVNQINIAIKQLRLDHLGGGVSDVTADSDDEGEGEQVESKTAEEGDAVQKTETVPKATNINLHVSGNPNENVFRLQIMIELIRMHIIKNNNKLKAADSTTTVSSNSANSTKGSQSDDKSQRSVSASSSTCKPYSLPAWDRKGDSEDSHSDGDNSDGSGDSDSSGDSLDELFKDLPPFVQAELKRQKALKPKKQKTKRPSQSSKGSAARSKSKFAQDMYGDEEDEENGGDNTS